MTDTNATLILEALRAAHHELTLVHNYLATDMPEKGSIMAATAWRVDAAATLAKLEEAMRAVDG